MEHKLDQKNDIRMSLTSDTLESSSTDQHSAIKSKISHVIDKIRKNKTRAHSNTIIEHRR